MTEKKVYQLLMVRCWLEQSGERVLWRCRVKNVHSGEEIGFTSPEQLFAYLSQSLIMPDSPSSPNVTP